MKQPVTILCNQVVVVALQRTFLRTLYQKNSHNPQHFSDDLHKRGDIQVILATTILTICSATIWSYDDTKPMVHTLSPQT